MTKCQIAIGGFVLMTSFGVAVYADTVKHPPAQSQESKEMVHIVDSPKAKEGNTSGSQADPKTVASAVSPTKAVKTCPITGKVLR